MRQTTTRYGAPVARGQRQRPVVTYGIIAICAVIFVAQLGNDEVTRALWFVPLVADLEPWRFLTSAFVHSPTFYGHIMFNMFAVWLCGQFLEPLLGWARYALLYLVSAVGGSVAYLLIAPRMEDSYWFTPTVGASGAVFGLFAASFVLSRQLGRDSAGILVVLGINVVLGFVVPNIAWEAHLGGLLTGAAIAGVVALTHPRDPERRRSLSRYQWVGFVLVVLVVVALALWGVHPLLGITRV